MNKAVLGLLTLLMLSGCATGYHSASNPILGYTGGHWDQEGFAKLHKVGFAGNAIVTHDKVRVYLLYRCAEIAQQKGKSHFRVYASILNAIFDKAETQAPLNLTNGKPDAYAYVLFSDAPAKDSFVTADVLRQYAAEVKGK